MGKMTAAAGYDCMVWIMDHNLSDDGAKQCITVIGLEKVGLLGSRVMILSVSRFQRAWMSSSVIRVDQCHDGVVTEKQCFGHRAELKWRRLKSALSIFLVGF